MQMARLRAEMLAAQAGHDAALQAALDARDAEVAELQQQHALDIDSAAAQRTELAVAQLQQMLNDSRLRAESLQAEMASESTRLASAEAEAAAQRKAHKEARPPLAINVAPCPPQRGAGDRANVSGQWSATVAVPCQHRLCCPPTKRRCAPADAHLAPTGFSPECAGESPARDGGRGVASEGAGAVRRAEQAIDGAAAGRDGHEANGGGVGLGKPADEAAHSHPDRQPTGTAADAHVLEGGSLPSLPI